MHASHLNVGFNTVEEKSEIPVRFVWCFGVSLTGDQRDVNVGDGVNIVLADDTGILLDWHIVYMLTPAL